MVQPGARTADAARPLLTSTTDALSDAQLEVLLSVGSRDPDHDVTGELEAATPRHLQQLNEELTAAAITVAGAAHLLGTTEHDIRARVEARELYAIPGPTDRPAAAACPADR